MSQLNYTLGQEVKIINNLTKQIYSGIVCPHYGYGNKTASVWIKFENIKIPFSTKTGKAYGKMAQFNKEYSILNQN